MLHLGQVTLHIILHFIEATGERDTPSQSCHADSPAPALNTAQLPGVPVGHLGSLWAQLKDGKAVVPFLQVTFGFTA